METLCEQLSTNITPLIGKKSADLARKIMTILHDEIGNCSSQEYTALFMRATALAHNTHHLPKTSVEENELLDKLTDGITRTH